MVVNILAENKKRFSNQCGGTLPAVPAGLFLPASRKIEGEKKKKKIIIVKFLKKK